MDRSTAAARDVALRVEVGGDSSPTNPLSQTALAVQTLAEPTFARIAMVEDPFTRRRLITFLGLHLLAFSSELAAMGIFILTGDYFFFVFILLPFLFSGFFCSHAAWHCSAPSSGYKCLPLKSWPLPLAVLLSVPLGFMQGVIVLLALEEYHARRGCGGPNSLESPSSPGAGGGQTRQSSNKFHCKAVNGLFEGLPSSAVILYAFWSLGYPVENPITEHRWGHERSVLGILGTISFLSSGLGLLELDFCVSRAIARRMRRSLRYEILHWAFRTTEVSSRVSLFINFMVTTRRHVWWWWVPLAGDFGVTFCLVSYYGGAEITAFVRLLCSIPCSFANVFQFIDSPYKRRAAMRLSRCLYIKHGVGLVLLPTLAVLGVGDNLMKELQQNWGMHFVMNLGALICIPFYWVGLWYVSSKSMHQSNMVDIYTACESGQIAAVRSAIRELTHSAAVGLNINNFDIDGITPLMLAASKGHAKVCQLLLQEGAQVDVRTFQDNRIISCLIKRVRRRWTALHIAAWRGHADVVRVLLEGIDGARDESTPSEEFACFEDMMCDTPLHIAVRAGHPETTRVLATGRPDWCEVRNAKGQLPLDLACVEEVRWALAAPPEESGQDRCRASPLLRCQQLPLSSGLADATGRDAQSQAWPQVQLSIKRSSNDCKLAPGLCSYIASSCGGALGRIFLQDTPPAIGRNHSVLTDISEADFESGSSIDPRRDSHRALPVVEPPGAPSGAVLPQQALGCAIEDLEPIDRNGAQIRWWTVMVQSQRASGSNLRSSNFTRVPEEAVLGEGSYGLVWRAKDQQSRQWYAVKNIKTLRRGDLSVATRECEVADHIRLKPHPCIVHLHHVHNFTDAGLYALVMEFCPGGDLLGRVKRARQEALRQSRPYTPPAQSLPWIGQIFLGLEHMHLRMDTLLRDLKPENVVLSTNDRAKLTDFGFGRFGVESSGRWSFGIPTGSPGYVAPEVLRQEATDSRADLFSLGVLVWVLLTGGLVTSPEPLPPMGKMRHGTDFEAHFKDYQLLAQCVADPERHGARRLREDARDFVARLTHRLPDIRMRHAEIRDHRLLQPLSLAAYDAPPSAVEAWLAGKDWAAGHQE